MKPITCKYRCTKSDKETQILGSDLWYKSFGLESILIDGKKVSSSITSYLFDTPGKIYEVEFYCAKLSGSVREIPPSAFFCCEDLISIDIPEDYGILGHNCLSCCSSLSKITIDPRNEYFYVRDGIIYERGEAGTMLYSYGSYSGTSLVIPEDVVEICPSAFLGNEKLESIKIPSSISVIGSDAFSGCSNLREVIIPNSIRRLEPGVFKLCFSLEKVQLPEGLESIGDLCFLACSKLSKINIPSSVTWIGSSIFSGCKNLGDNGIYRYVDSVLIEVLDRELSKYVISSGIKFIQSDSFKGCKNLSSIVIPEGVVQLGDNSFSECSNLSNISLPSSLVSIGNFVFSKCVKLNNFVMPNSVTSLGSGVFLGCNSLVNIKLSDSIEEAGSGLFEECINLPIMDGLQYADNTLLRVIDKKVAYTIREGTRIIDNSAFVIIDEDDYERAKKNDGILNPKFGDLESLRLPSSVIQVSPLAFYPGKVIRHLSLTNIKQCNGDSYCNIETLDLGPQITELGEGAFKFKDSIKRVNYTSSNIKIGKESFLGCSELIEIETGNIIEYGEGSFSSTALYSVTINSMIQDIPKKSFSNCNNLRNITYRGNSLILEEEAFSYCSELSNVSLTGSDIRLGLKAFSGCTGLITIDLSKGTSRIGEKSFENCNKLETVYIGEKINDPGNISLDSFSGCTNLKRVIYRYDTSIGQSAPSDEYMFRLRSRFILEDYKDVSIYSENHKS